MADRATSRRLLVIHWDGADEHALETLRRRGQLPAFDQLARTSSRRALAAGGLDAPHRWTILSTGAVSAPWWERARHEGRIAHTIGWPYHGSTSASGVTVSPAFAHAVSGAVVPASDEDMLASCRVDEREITPALLAAFVPALAEAQEPLGPELQAPLLALARSLASTASLHAAATALLARDDWDAVMVHCDALARLGARFGRFGPESGAAAILQRWFGPIVENALRFQDMMLERVLELAGLETGILLTGLPRTPPLSDSEADGFLYARTPVPVADTPLGVADFVPFLEEVSPFSLAPAAPPDEDPPAPMQGLQTVRFQKARALLNRGRPSEALPLLTALYDGDRLPAYGMQLLRCQLRLKRPRDARATLDRLLAERAQRLEDAEEHITLPAPLALLRAKVLYAEKAYPEAYASLQVAEEAAPQTALFYRRVGAVYLQLRAWGDSERAFRHALTIAPQYPAAHRWLAVALIRQGQYNEALASATRAAELRDPFPAAHYHRAIALLRLGRPAEAAEAAEVCVAQRPGFDRARYLLTQLYRDHLDQPAKAMKHLLATSPPTS